MGIWEWVTAILAIWGAVSILLAIGWWLGHLIVRHQVQAAQIKVVNQRVSEQAVTDIVKEMHRRNRQDGVR